MATIIHFWCWFQTVVQASSGGRSGQYLTEGFMGTNMIIDGQITTSMVDW